MITKPFYLCAENRRYNGNSCEYAFFELQTVRLYRAADGTEFFETVHEQDEVDEPCVRGKDEDGPIGPVLCGLYGKHACPGPVEHIQDFDSIEEGLEMLKAMGGKVHDGLLS